MASTHEFPQDTVYYTITNDSIELFQINDNVDNLDVAHQTLDEDLDKGAIVEFNRIPDKLDIEDANIGDKELPISPRLDSAVKDFVRSRLIEVNGGDLNTAQYFYQRYRQALSKKEGGKIKAGKPRRVMPDKIVRV